MSHLYHSYVSLPKGKINHQDTLVISNGSATSDPGLPRAMDPAKTRRMGTLMSHSA